MYSGDRSYFFIPRHLERTTYVPKYETFMKKCYAGEEIIIIIFRTAHTLASILCRAARIDRTTFYHRTTFFFQKLFLGVHSGLIRLLGAGGGGGGGGGDTETLHKIEAGRIFGG